MCKNTHLLSGKVFSANAARSCKVCIVPLLQHQKKNFIPNLLLLKQIKNVLDNFITLINGLMSVLVFVDLSAAFHVIQLFIFVPNRDRKMASVLQRLGQSHKLDSRLQVRKSQDKSSQVQVLPFVF